MNNYERIKNMSIDEMAEFSSVFQRCSFCIVSKKYKNMTKVNMEECRKLSCKEGCKKWLEAESEEQCS